jgi:hypothetical protein
MIFEVLTAKKMFFWVVMCWLVGRYQRFGVTYSLHLQGWSWTQYVSPKHRYLPTSPHGVSTQKNNFFITAISCHGNHLPGDGSKPNSSPTASIRYSSHKVQTQLKLSHYISRRHLGERSIAPTHSRPRHWWGWVVSVTPRPHFSPRERTPGTHCTGGWVGPRAGLNTEATGKIICLCRGSNLDRPVVQTVARHYTDWATWLAVQT